MARNKEKDRISSENRKLKSIQSGLCLHCNNPKISNWYCKYHMEKRRLAVYKNREKMGDKYKLRKLELSKAKRILILNAYGNKCVCCGESQPEFLQIDHINNDGNIHRRDVVKARYIYNWLIKNNFPKDNFQLLCANCNWAKRNGGICPHKINKYATNNT